MELKASHRTSCMMYETFLICLRMRTVSEQRVSLIVGWVLSSWYRDMEIPVQLSSKENPRCICVCVKSQTFPLLMILKWSSWPVETSLENLLDVHLRSLGTETDRPISLLQQARQMALLLAKVWEPLIYDSKYNRFQFSHVMKISSHFMDKKKKSNRNVKMFSCLALPG